MDNLDEVWRFYVTQRDRLILGMPGADFRQVRLLQRILADPDGLNDDERLAKFRAFCGMVSKSSLARPGSSALQTRAHRVDVALYLQQKEMERNAATKENEVRT